MAMVNGKIVGEKAKKIKRTLKRDKPLAEQAEELKRVKAKKAKKSEKPAGKDTELKRPKQKKVKETRKETSEPEVFRIQIGEHSFLSVGLVGDDAGNRVVAVRKWYNTKNDSEIKPGRGGFNIQPKSSEIKLLAAKLKAIAIELDAEG
ncbi:hypothetical protein MPK64_gp130 [Erwinia phage pEa_SNUABM_16]|uniref:Transcriptional coactivator p15 (PC4) C-terminal domain-containing protein n=1 Tax=Erwinia phage pEa_SNUABM_16 TaxID=2869544 RepID=A0AAE8XQS8_9CAUD|nr:hypothetical protein MPK64_gp130 [Erwinia phage pEa_SNUABM_16]QZE59033.1 hypothetical protein pEaSNUABM18_00130 [Erwinia phage pEa_SNUABM_18]UAW96274.1 hypothetical protein pEaSNUABM16_00130 [Erwinia phage pEa_SNUABM_16]